MINYIYYTGNIIWLLLNNNIWNINLCYVVFNYKNRSQARWSISVEKYKDTLFFNFIAVGFQIQNRICVLEISTFWILGVCRFQGQSRARQPQQETPSLPLGRDQVGLQCMLEMKPTQFWLRWLTNWKTDRVSKNTSRTAMCL